MVKQGDIIKINLNPNKGHEEAGYRPALIISNHVFNKKTNMTIVCPITNTNNAFPLHVALDDRTKSTGHVLCEHVRAIDLSARPYRYIEKIPEDLLGEILDIVFGQIERAE